MPSKLVPEELYSINNFVKGGRVRDAVYPHTTRWRDEGRGSTALKWEPALCVVDLFVWPFRRPQTREAEVSKKGNTRNERAVNKNNSLDAYNRRSEPPTPEVRRPCRRDELSAIRDEICQNSSDLSTEGHLNVIKEVGIDPSVYQESTFNICLNSFIRPRYSLWMVLPGNIFNTVVAAEETDTVQPAHS
ncbi:hypothetical protein J6590_010215 [Homalodisca vitripennis]|nr:hypothetical protein J6590_010215 [Homalodisca vitripennis]